MGAIFWIYRLVKVICNVLSYWEIRQFYIKALKIRMVSGTPGGLYQNTTLKSVCLNTYKYTLIFFFLTISCACIAI